MGGCIPALQLGKVGYFSTEKILGGELALYLLRLFAASVPVRQVRIGGRLWGVWGETGQSWKSRASVTAWSVNLQVHILSIMPSINVIFF